MYNKYQDIQTNYPYQNVPYNIGNANYQQPYNNIYQQSNDDRIIAGGFVAPFLLGGLTGAALAGPRPYAYPIAPYPYIYPPYPYYPRRFW